MNSHAKVAMSLNSIIDAYSCKNVYTFVMAIGQARYSNNFKIAVYIALCCIVQCCLIVSKAKE